MLAREERKRDDTGENAVRGDSKTSGAPGLLRRVRGALPSPLLAVRAELLRDFLQIRVMDAPVLRAAAFARGHAIEREA